MSTATEVTDLAEREEVSGELMPSAAQAAAQHEIQASFIMARRFPRNEDAAYARIMKACARPSFAGEVEYSYKRAGSVVAGPTIYFMREFARLWGNIRHGTHIVLDDDDSRTVRAFAWDLETNHKTEQDVTFQKLVQRKREGGGTVWVKPDERDLRELTNNLGSRAERNCLKAQFPEDMIQDGVDAARKTLQDKAAKDPEAWRKATLKAFAGLGVTAENLEAFLGHKLAQATPAEMTEMRTVYSAIREGSTTWAEQAAARSKSDALAGKLASTAAGSATSTNGAPAQPPSPDPTPAPAPVPDVPAPPPNPNAPPPSPEPVPDSTPPTPPKRGANKAHAVKTLRAMIKDRGLVEAQVAAAMVRLGLRGDEEQNPVDFGISGLSADDANRLIDELADSANPGGG